MDAIALLTNRMSAMTSSLHAIVEDVGDVDLTRPIAPGTSPVGLTLWHLPRTQDWIVNTTIRGTDEVVDSFSGRLPDPEVYGFGTALTPEQAQQAASEVALDDLLAYADAVGASVVEWLATLTEADLDTVPPLLDRQQRRAAYCTEGALEEVAGLVGLPVGVLMLRPALSHLLWHMGEVELLLHLGR